MKRIGMLILGLGMIPLIVQAVTAGESFNLTATEEDSKAAQENTVSEQQHMGLPLPEPPQLQVPQPQGQPTASPSTQEQQSTPIVTPQNQIAPTTPPITPPLTPAQGGVDASNKEFQPVQTLESGSWLSLIIPIFIGFAALGFTVIALRRRARGVGVTQAQDTGVCDTPVFCSRCNFGGDPCGKPKGHRGEHTPVRSHNCRQTAWCSGCNTHFPCTQLCGHEGEHTRPGHLCRFSGRCPTCRGSYPCNGQCGHDGPHTPRGHTCPTKCGICGITCGFGCGHQGKHYRSHFCRATNYKCERCGKTFPECTNECGHEGKHSGLMYHSCKCGQLKACSICGKRVIVCDQPLGHREGEHGGSVPPHGPCPFTKKCPDGCGKTIQCVKDCHSGDDHAFRHVCGAEFT